MLDPARTWLPRVVAAVTFCFYALIAPGGVFWLDSAELSAAAAGLGSPHPTGFPLFCLLGKAAQMVPLGEIAWRLNLMCALVAALAVLWTARLCVELGQRDVPALIGGVGAGATLAVSLVFARQATVAEVYAPTAALMAAALLCLHRVARGGGARDGLLLAVVCGLGLGTHATFLFIGPVVAALLCVRLYRGARWPLSAPLLTVLIACALYMYLPARSDTGRIGALDWGHPRTAESLGVHVSAERIRNAFGDEMRSTQLDVVGHNVGELYSLTVENVGPLLLMASLFGLIWLFRKRRARWSASALTALVFGDAVYSAWLNPMGAVDLQNTVPMTLGLCALAGVGLAGFARYLGRPGPYVGGVAVLVVFALPALENAPELWPAATGDLPRAFCESGLDATPPRGVILVQNDSTAAGLIYLTAIEGARPDVAVLVRQHFADGERVRAVLAHSGFPVDDIGRDSRTSTLSAPLSAIVARATAITWELGRDSIPAGSELVAGAPLARLVRSSEEKARAMRVATADAGSDIHGALAALERIFAHPGHRDRSAARVRADALTALGRLAYGRADLTLADLLFTAAVQVRPEHAPAWVNRGVVAAGRNDHARALAHAERALAIDPNRLTALINAGRYAIQLGDDGRARTHIDRSLRLSSSRADAWALAALLDLRARRPERAFERLGKARAIDPGHPDVIHLLRQLQQRRPESSP